MQLSFKKEVLPHLLAIAAFYAIVAFYFSPIVLDGKMMFQYDILQWEGAAKEIMDYRQQHGEEPLWTNRMFGGMPAYLVSMETSGDVTNFLMKILTLGLPHPINSLFFGMLGMYLLLLSFKIRTEIAVAGAIGFAFNSFHFLSLEAGHNAKIWAICLIPMVFAGIHLAFTNKKILGVSIMALALMLQIKFNHLQITYYTLIMVLVYGLGQLVSAYKGKALQEFAKVTAFLILGAFLAAGANAGRLLPVLEYGDYSIRGKATLETNNEGSSGLDKDYAFYWSQGVVETFTLLIPNFHGGGSRESLPKNSAAEAALRTNGVTGAELSEFIKGAPTYWGNQPSTGGPIYGGAIMVFFFVLGLFLAPKKYRNVFLTITIISLLLSWGKNLAWFNYSLFDYLPGYNKFRAVSMALCMALFAIPVLGSLGLEKLVLVPKDKANQKAFLISVGIVGGLCLIFYVFSGLFGFRGAADSNYPDWLANALMQDRKSMLQSDAIRSLVFILLSVALVFAFIKEKINYTMACAGVCLLVLMDVWGINRRYLDNDSFILSPSADFFAATPADEKIMADSDYFRVLNLQNTFQEARTSYRFNSIGGYHGAKMRRYQDLVDRILGNEITEFVQKAQKGNFDYQGIHILNMLNTKYILAGSAENAVFRNDYANGPAWFPKEVIPVTTNEEEIATLAQMNTKEQVTVNFVEFGDIQAGSGDIELTHYEPNLLRFKVDVAMAGLVVFSEIYYPKGWKVFVNGEETRIIRANYLLRGVGLNEGAYDLEFRFEPTVYANSAKAMIGFQYLILLFFGFGIFIQFKSPKKDATA